MSNPVIKESHKLVRIAGALLRDGDEFLHQHAQFVENGLPGYGDCLFTLKQIDECDALVVFNTPSEPLSVTVPENHIYAFMMEPGYHFVNPWMYEGLDQYSKVYSPKPVSSNIIASHGFLGWSVDKSMNQLVAMNPPEKTRRLSCILSDAHIYSGHRSRLAFIQKLIDRDVQFELMGKGFHPVKDKWSGLAPYLYSIALENGSMPHYFTEKITDCFLAWTLPIYWGCTNLEEYFPPESFIRIDVEKPDEAVEIIRSLSESDYERRFEALAEARRLVISEYQPLAKINNLLHDELPASKSKVSIKPVLPNPFLKKIFGIWKNYGNRVTDRLLGHYYLDQMRLFAHKTFD